MKVDLFIEFNGKQINEKLIKDEVKRIWKSKGNKIKDLEILNLYYKPDENNCYYIINNSLKGKISI